MLPSLTLSSSSLDSFRKNVYRPRLCLLLLLVLLSPYYTSQLTAPADGAAVSISQPAQPGWSLSVIDGMVVAAPPPASALLSTASSIKSKKDADASIHSAASQPSPAPAAKQISSGGQSQTQQGQPPPGSLFRFPKLSWGLIVDEHVLPALLPLHLLWAIRLAGTAVEDGLVKNSLLGAKSRFYSVTLPLIYLGVLSVLAILTGQPGFSNAIRKRCYTWRTQLGFDTLAPAEHDKGFKANLHPDGLLPISLFVMLECASTLVHLISILPKVDAALIARLVPSQISLPSPSHLPPLVELLPLPRSLKAALTEPVPSAAAPRYARHRRPMMPSISTTSSASAADNPTPVEHSEGAQTTAVTSAVNPTPNDAATTGTEALPQQVYRRVGAPDNEVLRSTSVTRPIAPLQLPENVGLNPEDSASRRRRAPRLRGQSVLVSTKWISETTTSLFDKLIGTLIYAIITLRLPTLSPASLPPVLSLLSLRSELAGMTKIWTRARSSIECLEFVRRRWGVQLKEGEDPYASVVRPRAAKEAGDYQWKSHDDVYCAICFEMTRCGVRSGEEGDGRVFEFCRLDCGHELHDVCLVSWLTAQAFCPTCHVVLSFSPRASSASRRTNAQT